MDPLTPIAEMVGEVGRTPVPVAESTHQPREKPFTPGEVYGEENFDKWDYPQNLRKGKGGLIEDPKVSGRRGSPIGHCLDQQNHVHLYRRI